MINLGDNEFNSLILCAFRYALERETGISFEICNLIEKHKNILPGWIKGQMIRDIQHKIDGDGFKQACDMENWKVICEKLKSSTALPIA